MLEVEEVTLGLGLPLLKFKLQADCQAIQSSLHCAYVHVILLSLFHVWQSSSKIRLHFSFLFSA